MPRREAAFTSMVLWPAPARTTSLSAPAASTASGTLVERTTRTSGRNCATSAASASSLSWGAKRTSHPSRASSSRPDDSNSSAISTRMASDPVLVGAPRLDCLLDVLGREILVGRAGRQGHKLGVGGEAQGDDLQRREARVQQFAGHDEVAKVLFGANGAILRLQREDSRVEGQQQQAEGKNRDQRSAVQSLMIVDGMVEVDDGADERQDQNPEQDDVVPGDVPGVIGVVLGGHGARILLSTSYRAAGQTIAFRGLSSLAKERLVDRRGGVLRLRRRAFHDFTGYHARPPLRNPPTAPPAVSSCRRFHRSPRSASGTRPGSTGCRAKALRRPPGAWDRARSSRACGCTCRCKTACRCGTHATDCPPETPWPGPSSWD